MDFLFSLSLESLLKKLVCLFDMDAILVNLSSKWVAAFNKEHGKNLTKGDVVKYWHMAKHDGLKEIGEVALNRYLYEDGFFLDLEPLPGALEAVEAIHNLGHKVYIVSSPSWPGTSAQDKISWVRRHLPFINKRKIFLCHEKSMVKGDVFVDDSPDNLKLYRREWPEAKIMTIAYPYNESAKDLVDVYADGWADTAKAWKTIYESIAAL